MYYTDTHVYQRVRDCPQLLMIWNAPNSVTQLPTQSCVKALAMHALCVAECMRAQLTSSSGGVGPCPGGCAAQRTSPAPSHTPLAACTHSQQRAQAHVPNVDLQSEKVNPFSEYQQAKRTGLQPASKGSVSASTLQSRLCRLHHQLRCVFWMSVQTVSI